MGGNVVTYSALLCDNSTQGALGDVWTRVEVTWDFEGRHCCLVSSPKLPKNKADLETDPGCQTRKV